MLFNENHKNLHIYIKKIYDLVSTKINNKIVINYFFQNISYWKNRFKYY